MKRNKCHNCGNYFDCRASINGKIIRLYNRKFCIDCSPIGGHNTKSYFPTKETLEERQINRLETHRRSAREYARKHKEKRTSYLRLEAIMKLGGKCSDCGISNIEILTIDHIYGCTKSEKTERRNRNSGEKYYRQFITDLISGKRTDGQVLTVKF